jgi:hypothetical protein
MFYITKKIGRIKVAANVFFQFFYYQNALVHPYIKCLVAYLKLKCTEKHLHKMTWYINKTKMVYVTGYVLVQKIIKF